MKQIKAFIHRNRVADVVNALKNEAYDGAYNSLSIVHVQGASLQALDAKEQNYSIELGIEMITEVKIEIFCQDDYVDKAVSIIREKGRTGQNNAGWIYVMTIQQSYPVE